MGEVYNVEHIDFKILGVNEGDSDYLGDGVGKLEEGLKGISDEGFGITPQEETGLIEGLKGEQGFSVDPSDSVEGSVALKSTSESIQPLLNLYKAQTAGDIPPFKIMIDVSSGDEGGTSPPEAVGFKEMIVNKAMFVSYSAFETDGRDSPDYEFEFVGYDLTIVGPDGERTGGD